MIEVVEPEEEEEVDTRFIHRAVCVGFVADKIAPEYNCLREIRFYHCCYHSTNDS
jgi:hypothetical protein